jgi:putative oxidoreductase
MTGSDTLAAPMASRGRVVNVTLWVFQVLLAVLFAFAGINKLFGLMPEMVDQFTKIGAGVWFRYFVGAVELAGAIGLLIPRLSGLAALGLACVMAGAILTHLFVLPPMDQAVGPAVPGLVSGLIAWSRWPRTQALAGSLNR